MYKSCGYEMGKSMAIQPPQSNKQVFFGYPANKKTCLTHGYHSLFFIPGCPWKSTASPYLIKFWLLPFLFSWISSRSCRVLLLFLSFSFFCSLHSFWTRWSPGYLHWGPEPSVHTWGLLSPPPAHTKSSFSWPWCCRCLEPKKSEARSGCRF